MILLKLQHSMHAAIDNEQVQVPGHNIIIKNFAWEDQSQKQCYIADIEPDKAVIEPETREQCYIG